MVERYPGADSARDAYAANPTVPLILAKDDVRAFDALLGQVRAGLDSAGAVLLRGHSFGSAQRLRAATQQLGLSQMDYNERTTRRRAAGERVYGTTEHPARLSILPHNENAYASSWPAILALTCVQPALAGGETPLYDCRQVLRALDAVIVEELCRREVLHVRNFGTGLGLSLEEAYGVRDRKTIERMLGATGSRFEWSADGGLRVTWRTKPVLIHPRTGEACFFSHVAFFHQSALPDELQADLLETFGPWGLPNNTFYGDGSEIPVSIIEAVLAAYRRQERTFDWRAGDLLFVDNMLCAHARRSFTGNRQVLITLCDAVQRDEVRFV